MAEEREYATVEQAVDFIKELLQRGPVDTVTANEKRSEFRPRITRKTLRAARKKLDIKTIRHDDDTWIWTLPDDRDELDDDDPRHGSVDGYDAGCYCYSCTTAKRASDREAYQRDRKKALDYLGGSCKSCGSREKLELDHVDPKTKKQSVSNLLGKYPWKVIENELALCQLLCATCHNIKSVKEGSVPLGFANGNVDMDRVRAELEEDEELEDTEEAAA